MPKSYEYVRRTGLFPSKRKGNQGLWFMLFLVLVFISFAGYYLFFLNPSKKESETNDRIARIFIDTSNAAKNLVMFAERGPVKDEFRKSSFSHATRAKKEAENLILTQKNLTSEQFKILLFLYELNTRIETIAGVHFNEVLMRQSLPLIVNRWKVLKSAVVVLNTTEDMERQVKKTSLEFSGKIYRPEIQQSTDLKKRGLGIVSYSTKPKFSGRDESGRLYLDKTELLDLNIEIQNQGEVVENQVEVTLELTRTDSTETVRKTEIIDSIRPLERKPVSFVAIPLERGTQTEYRLVITVKPVPGEKVLQNNRLEFIFFVRN